MSNKRKLWWEYKSSTVSLHGNAEEIAIEILKRGVIRLWWMDQESLKIYISMHDHDYLTSHVFLYEDLKLYVIDKNLWWNMKCRGGLFLSSVKIRNIFRLEWPHVYGMNNCDPEKVDCIYLYWKVLKKFPDYFILGRSWMINYDNMDRLMEILWYLLLGKKISDIPGYIDGLSYLLLDWWKFRGWNEELSIDKISLILSEFGKRSGKKKLLIENWGELHPTKLLIEWWIRLGYDLEEAEMLRSEWFKKNTFCLENMVEKYGLEEGERRYYEGVKNYKEGCEKRKENMKRARHKIGRKKKRGPKSGGWKWSKNLDISLDSIVTE